MRERVVTWERGMGSLGRAVLAIGVFDGVHLGHQALLADAAVEARHLGARSVALTFDRDPDQVVTPDSAAPQLLTLEDKCRFILETGIQTVLVVPFTSVVAMMTAEKFLDEVLGRCCDVSAIHVGSDFRFGAKAAGDVDTLYVWGVEHNAEIRPHQLIEVDDRPVTSTRIRALVKEGRVAEAGRLLGRPTRITGTVGRGRAQGAALGFPTANVEPVEYAALPADGVYAGRAETDSGEVFPAAISVGVPPSFPEARDYLEAHLIGFEGDLYETRLTLQLIERLRDLRSFSDVNELKAAIAEDVEAASTMARAYRPPAGYDGQDWEPHPFAILGQIADALGLSGEESIDYLEDGTPVIDDPGALAAAERVAAGSRSLDQYEDLEEDWVELVGPRHLGGIYSDAGFVSSIVTAPLQAAEIPFAWSPYPPELMPSSLAMHGGHERTFSLLVPRSRLAEAQRVMRGRL